MPRIQSASVSAVSGTCSSPGPNRKLGQIERAVTKWGGVFSQAMAIGKTGYASEFFEAHPNWFLLKVTENALPNAHQYHREWIENYFNGPDWQAEVGIAI